jgi:O-antigen/teichoic acid export membrane protein
MFIGSSLINRLITFYKSGHERTLKAKKNILISLFLKGPSIGIGLILIPLTINYVDVENYGIWLTISSIVGWVSFFDIGLSNGLRNKFGEAVAVGDYDRAQQYVSTTYAILMMIFIPLFLIFSIANIFIDWPAVLNVSVLKADELRLVTYIVFAYFCLRIILNSINIILIADQRPANASFRKLLEQVISLLIIYILTLTTNGSLLNLTIGLCVAPLLTLLLFNITLFSGRYKNVSPKIKQVDFKLKNELLGLGFKFFIIQIAVLVQFQTANFIIIRYFGADEVTNYNIARKYFITLTMVFSILISPMWSAVTNAIAQDDKKWIKNMVKKYQKFVWLFLGVGLIMLIASSYVYDLWLGKGKVNISFSLSAVMFLFVFSSIAGRVQGTVLNGIGALNLQFYVSIFSPILFLLLCYIMIIHLGWGVESVIAASIIASFNGYILAPLQFHKIFYQHKTGIWIS